MPRHRERHVVDRIGWLRAAVLGANDGIVSVASLIIGVAAAGQPRGAILLTGYLGGAVATHLRVGSPLVGYTLFGVYLGIMLWSGLWLRDSRIRALLPLTR